MHFHYRVTFTGYIRCLCATTSHDHFDLHLWPFDLESVSCTALLMVDPQTNFYYPMTIGYWVTSTEYLITFPLSETVTAHAPCHGPLTGGKNSPHFWNPSPNTPIYFINFRALRRKLSHVIGKKIAFSHYEDYKVYCACAVSRDPCIGGPPKPYVTIFWPRIAYSLYNFMRLLWRLRVVYIWASPC